MVLLHILTTPTIHLYLDLLRSETEMHADGLAGEDRLTIVRCDCDFATFRAVGMVNSRPDSRGIPR